DGPAWTHEIDAAVESILAGLNPEGLALEDVLGLYAAVTGPGEGEDLGAAGEDYEEVVAERMLGIIVDIVRHGIVVPSSLVDWAESEEEDHEGSYQHGESGQRRRPR